MFAFLIQFTLAQHYPKVNMHEFVGVPYTENSNAGWALNGNLYVVTEYQDTPNLKLGISLGIATPQSNKFINGQIY